MVTIPLQDCSSPLDQTRNWKPTHYLVSGLGQYFRRGGTAGQAAYPMGFSF
jgi:hypothetical protein